MELHGDRWIELPPEEHREVVQVGATESTAKQDSDPGELHNTHQCTACRRCTRSKKSEADKLQD
jgi:hypothetical protein